jgi:hypothetical protein
MKTLKKEQRLYPRLNQELPIKIAADGYDFATTSKNISCLGAYCSIARYIPPFTKILIRLSLPIFKNGTSSDFNVECKGVVVRSEDDPSGNFNIAIFFNEIKESQKDRISQYVNQFLP